MNEPTEKSLVIDYLLLRKVIGYLGVALPFVLAIGNMLIDKPGIQNSISDYYYTGMRNIFVGTMCAIGVFLISYKGYREKDDVAGILACFFAVGAALCPTTPHSAPTPCQQLIGNLHLLFATLFLLTLAYFSICQFPKTHKGSIPKGRKRQRNFVYKVCGYTMLVALLLCAVFVLLPDGTIPAVMKLDPIFWLESIAIVAFGISWLTKGQAILRDKQV